MSSVLKITPADHVLGSGPAPSVTLIEYVDFECPYCRKAEGVIRRLQRKFGTSLRYVYRSYPLTEIHPFAMKAAEAAEAANAQGKFWEMHDLLFRNQEKLALEDLVAYADELELDVRKFVQELRDGTYEARVEMDIRSGDEAAIEETPTFFINGQRFEGPCTFQALGSAIQEAVNPNRLSRAA